MDFISQWKHTSIIFHKYRVTMKWNANKTILKSNSTPGATLSAEKKD